jgi:hypothetical protein
MTGVVIFIAIVALCFLEFLRFRNQGLINFIAAVFFAIYFISLFYFVSLLLSIPYLYLNLILSLCLICFLYFRKSAYRQHLKSISFSISYTHLIFFGLLTVIMTQFASHISDWGRWDAIAIWNYHAKFLFFENHWSDYLRNYLSWSHPDYPLLLPSAIAYFWKAFGIIDSTIPFLLSLFFTLSIPIVLFAALPKQTYFQKIWAISVPTIFVSSDVFLKWYLAQMADAPLSLAILLAIVYFRNYIEEQNKGAFYLSLFMAAAACWIKNEAIFFFLSFLLVSSIGIIRAGIKAVLISLAIVVSLLAIPLCFKFFVAPPNDLISATRLSVVAEKLVDFDRYKIIALFVFNAIKDTSLGLLFIIPFVLIVLRFRMKLLMLSPPFQVMLLCFLFYCTIYVFTPKDLIWHLETSLIRLFLHLAPALVFILVEMASRQKRHTSSK